MKRGILILLLIILEISQMTAQISSLIGEYYLQGVMETASGFRLNSDSSFDFFYSYGALDRGGKGNWKVEGSQLILNSFSSGSDAFVLKEEKKISAPGFLVRIDDANPFFKKYVHGFVSGKSHEEEQQSNSDGILHFSPGTYDSLMLMMEFCPEKVFRMDLKGNENNEFVFTFDPALMEVVFQNFTLKIDSKGLIGKHPLLVDKEYFFEKAE